MLLKQVAVLTSPGPDRLSQTVFPKNITKIAIFDGYCICTKRSGFVVGKLTTQQTLRRMCVKTFHFSFNGGHDFQFSKLSSTFSTKQRQFFSLGCSSACGICAAF